MGNMCCGLGRYEMLQRLDTLKEGQIFTKKTTYLGVLNRNESIHLRLHEAATRLQWRVTPGTNKWEELPIYRVGKVCPSGDVEFLILGPSGQKLLELVAESTGIRDLWVQTLDELCLGNNERCSKDGDSKELQRELTKQTDKQKERYWKERTNEIEQRRLDAEERKKKIGLVGMKYTAQAMAQR